MEKHRSPVCRAAICPVLALKVTPFRKIFFPESSYCQSYCFSRICSRAESSLFSLNSKGNVFLCARPCGWSDRFAGAYDFSTDTAFCTF